MRLENVFRGLEFVGTAEGRRRTYQVFEGAGHFLVVTFRQTKSGYFTVVDREAVDRARQRFAGKTVTSSDLNKNLRGRTGAFDSLNVLYVLVAQRRATIDRRRSQPGNAALQFRLRAS